MKKIYLAGPEVFRPNAMSVFREMKAECQTRGLQGMSPFDSEFQASDKPGIEDALAIFRINRRLIDESQAVVANLTPFRGPSADVGTVWEIAYAMGNDIPVFGYSTDRKTYRDKVIADTAKGRFAHVEYDASGLLYVDGMIVEPFGLRDNLMIEGSLMQQRVLGTGIVMLDSFEQALDTLVARIGAD